MYFTVWFTESLTNPLLTSFVAIGSNPDSINISLSFQL